MVNVITCLWLMSEEQLKAFLEKAKSDASLEEKLKAAADLNAVLAIAKEAGFCISDDGFKKAQSELSEAELEDVDGGSTPNTKCSYVLSIGGPSCD